MNTIQNGHQATLQHANTSKTPSEITKSTFSTQKTKNQKKKRTLEEVMADIPDPMTVIFDPLCIPSKHPPILHLPPNIDTDDPYALFCLFWPERMWTTIATNTNLYAVEKRMKSEEDRMRPWHDTCSAELKVFIGILIYMGLHQSYAEHIYWRDDFERGPLHTCATKMSLCRYQALKRYLHISPSLNQNTYEPSTEEEEYVTPDEELQKLWWHKVEPLASTIREACLRHYTPSSDVSIDELMIRCYGRSQHTYKMPDKPIQMGYKLFGLADHGYMWWFVWSSRKHGLAELMKHKDLTPTGSMVLGLAKRLPKLIGQPFTVYLDNYFTSIALFRIMRGIGIGACGTTRTTSSHEEFPALLKEIKEDHSKVC
jgi:hypothetical protein